MGVIVPDAPGTLPASKVGWLGCGALSRRAAMRSTMDLRAMLFVADVSGKEDRGVARFCILEVSTIAPLS